MTKRAFAKALRRRYKFASLPSIPAESSPGGSQDWPDCGDDSHPLSDCNIDCPHLHPLLPLQEEVRQS